MKHGICVIFIFLLSMTTLVAVVGFNYNREVQKNIRKFDKCMNTGHYETCREVLIHD